MKIIVAIEHPVNRWPEFAAWYGAYPDQDPMVPVASSEAALQLYISGITGRPKATQLTHSNLISAFFRPKANGDPGAQWSDDDVSMLLLPIAHISGTGGGFLCYCAGATNVVVRDFEPANVLRLIVAIGVSRLVLAPSAIKLLLDHPDVADGDFSRLHHILYSASPIPLDLLRAAIRVFGCGLRQVDGMTETTDPIIYLPPKHHDPNGNRRMRGTGTPFPLVRLRAMFWEDGDQQVD